MPDDDSRPRPRYGEYASHEEQRARMGSVETARTSTPRADTSSERPRNRTLDRVVTVALLAYGLVNVFQSFSIFPDPTRLLDAMQVSVSLSDPTSARTWGTVACAVLIVGWVATAWVSWRLAAKGARTFWVPLAGGLIFTLLASIIVVVPLMGDEAVLDAILRSAG